MRKSTLISLSIASLFALQSAQAATMYPIRVKSSNVWIKIVKFSGDVRINGIVDKPENSFWSNIQIIGRSVTFPQNNEASKTIISGFHNPSIGNNSTEWTGVWIMNDGKDAVDAAVNAKIQSDFAALRTAISRPAQLSQDGHETALKNFVHKGINVLSFDVQPLSDPWTLEVQIYTLENSSEEVIQDTYIDNTIGKSSPKILINIEDDPN